MLRAILFLGVIVLAAGDCFGQTQKPCFAFILRGDVAVSCEGGAAQITHRGDLEGFAVSNERTTLAYTTSRVIRRTGSVAVAASTATVVDLSTGSDKRVEGIRGVVSTCGALLSLVGPGSIEPPIRDLITGEEVSFPPYVRFRCSSDRKAVVGATKDQGGDLYEGVPPKAKIAEAGSFSVYRFNISPDGSKVTYYADLRPLCVSPATGLPACTSEKGTFADVPSVNDSGEVLFALGTSQECYYKTSYNFSPKPFPGATDENRDQCLAIAYWKPGLKSVQIIERIGRNPQWITPATADLLRSWSTHTAQSGGK